MHGERHFTAPPLTKTRDSNTILARSCQTRLRTLARARRRERRQSRASSMPSMLNGGSSASACGNCSGALDVKSRSTTETMTDEVLQIRVQHYLLLTAPRATPIAHHDWCCRAWFRSSCCLRQIMEVVYHVVVRTIHTSTMCDGRWIQGITCDTVSMSQ
jgi:hypothetical protein